MTEILSRVGFEVLAGDDEVDLDRLTVDLEAGLSEVGEVSRIPRSQEPGDKGAGELVQGALSVLTAVDPVQIEAMIRILVGFAKRDGDRRISVQIGRDKISIEGASEQHIDDLVAAFTTAVERQKR